jgi:hypothetical protein
MSEQSASGFAGRAFSLVRFIPAVGKGRFLGNSAAALRLSAMKSRC